MRSGYILLVCAAILLILFLGGYPSSLSAPNLEITTRIYKGSEVLRESRELLRDAPPKALPYLVKWAKGPTHGRRRAEIVDGRRPGIISSARGIASRQGDAGKQLLFISNLARESGREKEKIYVLLPPQGPALTVQIQSGERSIWVFSARTFNCSSRRCVKRAFASGSIERYVRSLTFFAPEPISNLEPDTTSEVRRNPPARAESTVIPTPTIEYSVWDDDDSAYIDPDNVEDDDYADAHENFFLSMQSYELFKAQLAALHGVFNEDLTDAGRAKLQDAASLIQNELGLEMPPVVAVYLPDILNSLGYFSLSSCDTDDEVLPLSESRARYWDSPLADSDTQREVERSLMYEVYSITDAVDNGAAAAGVEAFLPLLPRLIRLVDRESGCRFIEDHFRREEQVATPQFYKRTRKNNWQPFYAWFKASRSADARMRTLVQRVHQDMLHGNPTIQTRAKKIAHHLNLVLDPNFITKGLSTEQDLNFYLGGTWGLLVNSSWDPVSDWINGAFATATAAKLAKGRVNGKLGRQLEEIETMVKTVAERKKIELPGKAASGALNKVLWIIEALNLIKPALLANFDGGKAAFVETQRNLAMLSVFARLQLIWFTGEGVLSPVRNYRNLKVEELGIWGRSALQCFRDRRRPWPVMDSYKLPGCWPNDELRAFERYMYPGQRITRPRRHALDGMRSIFTSPVARQLANLRRMTDALWSAKADVARTRTNAVLLDEYSNILEGYAMSAGINVAGGLIIKNLKTLNNNNARGVAKQVRPEIQKPARGTTGSLNAARPRSKRAGFLNLKFLFKNVKGFSRNMPLIIHGKISPNAESILKDEFALLRKWEPNTNWAVVESAVFKYIPKIANTEKFIDDITKKLEPQIPESFRSMFDLNNDTDWVIVKPKAAASQGKIVRKVMEHNGVNITYGGKINETNIRDAIKAGRRYLNVTIEKESSVQATVLRPVITDDKIEFIQEPNKTVRPYMRWHTIKSRARNASADAVWKLEARVSSADNTTEDAVLVGVKNKSGNVIWSLMYKESVDLMLAAKDKRIRDKAEELLQYSHFSGELP